MLSIPARVSSEAFLTSSIESKYFINAFRLVAPIPGMSSKIDVPDSYFAGSGGIQWQIDGFILNPGNEFKTFAVPCDRNLFILKIQTSGAVVIIFYHSADRNGIASVPLTPTGQY